MQLFAADGVRSLHYRPTGRHAVLRYDGQEMSPDPAPLHRRDNRSVKHVKVSDLYIVRNYTEQRLAIAGKKVQGPDSHHSLMNY